MHILDLTPRALTGEYLIIDETTFVLCHSCGEQNYVDLPKPPPAINPLVKIGLIPESLGEILVPPPEEAHSTYKKRVANCDRGPCYHRYSIYSILHVQTPLHDTLQGRKRVFRCLCLVADLKNHKKKTTKV